MSKATTLLLFLSLVLGTAFAQSENASELATEDVRPVNVVLTSAVWTLLLAADFKKPGKKTCSLLYPWNAACLPEPWLMPLLMPLSSLGYSWMAT